MALLMVPVESLYTRIHDNRIHYLSAGEGETVLMIHGFPTSSHLWRRILPALGAQYHLLAPDMLGYGKSDKPQDVDVSISAQADRMKDFIELFTQDPITIAAHGIGGAVAQMMAVRYPERISRMILINSACYDAWPTPPDKALQDPRLEKKLSVEQLEDRLRRNLMQGVVHKDQFGAVDEFIRPWSTPWGVGAFLQNARALDSRETNEIIPDLKNLDIPVLILWGREDPWLKPRLAERLHRDITGSRLEILPGIGHYATEDDPDLICEKISDFLQVSAVAHTPQYEPVTA